MWPLGQYDRLVHEIKRREDNSIPVTFGLLIADYNQQTCREYILNYIDNLTTNQEDILISIYQGT